MNWYLQSGKESDIAINTRIRFSRNIKGYNFHLSPKELQELENKIKDNVYQIRYGLRFLKLEDMDDITKLSLVEKGLINYNFAFESGNIGAILVNDEENICMMIGEDDHLKIQVFSSGLELENTLNLAIEIDKKIEEIFSYCVSKQYGYLTACPNNIGTGLKASVKLHLPALAKTRNTEKVLEAINNFGINIKGVYDEEGHIVGDMYEISNKKTLGITENEIIQNIKIVVEKVIKQERAARRFLANEGIEVEDLIYRNYGILTNCKKITMEEAQNLLSTVKLGVDLGILKELSDLQIQKLYLYIQPGNLQKYFGEQYERLDREMKRAEMIKQVINQ